MPFQDLPSRREESAPIFDGSDPCEIECYFDNLEFLFLKHCISDDSEKKHAAVRYPGLAPEQLWKTALAFSDPTCTYEEFKAEVIALYPEATAEHEYTRARFEQLVSDRTRTEIHSETELGEFYPAFLLTSRILISKGRLGVPEQAHGFLGSFEPRLGTAIRSRLERTFPDHFPDVMDWTALISLLQIIIGTAFVLILSHSPSLHVTLISDDSRTCDRLGSIAFHYVPILGQVY
jgi:hypothetical protein